MYYITKKQLNEICANNSYIVLRYHDNSISALNCKTAFLSRFNNIIKDDSETNYTGWYKCSFMEYIRLKTPFL